MWYVFQSPLYNCKFPRVTYFNRRARSVTVRAVTTRAPGPRAPLPAGLEILERPRQRLDRRWPGAAEIELRIGRTRDVERNHERNAFHGVTKN